MCAANLWESIWCDVHDVWIKEVEMGFNSWVILKICSLWLGSWSLCSPISPDQTPKWWISLPNNPSDKEFVIFGWTWNKSSQNYFITVPVNSGKFIIWHWAELDISESLKIKIHVQFFFILLISFSNKKV